MLDRLKTHVADLLLPARRSMSELDALIAAAGKAHIAARRALAVAVAEEDREIQRRTSLAANAGDLEVRAIEALTGGREDLAARAAEAIAVVETEVAASAAASVRFAAKVALNPSRGRRTAPPPRRSRPRAAPGQGRRGARRLRRRRPTGVAPLARAEAALLRVEAEQADAEAVRVAFAPSTETLADDMAEAGFGRPTRVLAADVMTRLRALASPVEQLPRA